MFFMSSARRQFFAGLILMSALILAGWSLFRYVSETGLPGFSKSSDALVQLNPQSDYRIKTRRQLLGMDVIRIVSRRQPEEFLVVDRVPSNMVDSMYGKPVNLAWANTVAGQFLKLRDPSGETTSGSSIEIQDIKTLKSGTVTRNNEKLPYWRIEVRFKVNNEPNSRYYKADVIRRPVHPKERDTETLVVGYAQGEVHQPELLADLLDNLQFARN